ncbi:MAG: NYN domain-containing protein [Actinomycetaceae bacterium]|nr:NYN domain-containing protein [Actinomycetaceae bacterium]
MPTPRGDGQKKKRSRAQQPSREPIARRPIVTAVLVDGGFYRKRAYALFGDKNPQQRADELLEYCRRHIRQSRASLYRIYYYDCPPSDKVLYHPLTQQQVNLRKSPQFEWTQEFFRALLKKRKVALRRGEELETQQGFTLKPGPLKKLLRGTISVEDLSERDFLLDITQKGVDMRLGLDISTLAERNLVNQIVMIAGDSDFVPAAKHARRSGIDFILDPMWSPITDSLSEHIDGIRECVASPPNNENDPLHVTNLGKAGAKHLSTEDDDEL